MSRARWFAGPFLALAFLAPTAAHAQSGAIRGQVTDAATHQPIAGATIAVGTRGTLVRDDGAYFIADVPVGSRTIIARMLGYAEGTRTVTVAAGDTVVVEGKAPPSIPAARQGSRRVSCSPSARSRYGRFASSGATSFAVGKGGAG